MTSSFAGWCRIVRDANTKRRGVLTQRRRITGPADAAAIFGERLCREEVEVLAVMLLDAQMQVIGLQEVTRGLVNSSLVHPREVFRLAIAMNASALLVAHNHPSGILDPSREDRQTTDALGEAGKILGIPLHDHLILGLTPSDYYSFANNGLI